MAVSPTVQMFMRDRQGPPPAGAEQSFNKRFGDAAFNLFRVKAPTLLPLVVTFEILSSDLDKETGLGVFVIRAGRELRYVPVVLSGGAVNSCEMLYNRTEDQFSPLSEQAVADIQGRNAMLGASVLRRAPHVEDTRQLFRDMLRPPASSNVVLASDKSGVEALPAPAREAVGRHLAEHPGLLGKLALFYPPARLGEKLAPGRPEPAPPAWGPAVLRLEAVTKEAATFLREEEKAELLRHGYVVKRAAKEKDMLVIPDHADHPEATAPRAMETEWRAEVWPPLTRSSSGASSESLSGPLGRPPQAAGQAQAFKALALCCTAEGFRQEPLILAGNLALGADGTKADLRDRGMLLTERSELVSKDDLQAVGAVRVDELAGKLAGTGAGQCRIEVFCPARHGGYLVPEQEGGSYPAKDYSLRTIGGEVYLTPPPGLWGRPVRVTSGLRFGWLRRTNELVVPRTALFAVVNADESAIAGMLGSFDELRSLLHGLGTPLRVARDGVALHLTDARREKTASFRDEAGAAEWLNDVFGLSGPQIRAVLEHPRTVLLSKQAFETPEQLGMVRPPGYATEGEPPAGSADESPDDEAGTARAPVFDPSLLEAWADTGEPEMVDTGILAAFAGDPDIKALLADYLPDFLTVLDRIGRVILLFNLEKTEFEGFYGRDAYARTLGSLRKIFKQVGDLVHTLRQYVNMH